MVRLTQANNEAFAVHSHDVWQLQEDSDEKSHLWHNWVAVYVHLHDAKIPFLWDLGLKLKK